MKVKEIKVYQAVNFFKQMETHFSKENSRWKDLKMETVDFGVRITNDNDDIIVSFNNIAYIKPEKNQESKKSKDS